MLFHVDLCGLGRSRCGSSSSSLSSAVCIVGQHGVLAVLQKLRKQGMRTLTLSQEVVLSRLRLCEKTVFVRVFVLAWIANSNIERIVPLPINIRTLALLTFDSFSRSQVRRPIFKGVTPIRLHGLLELQPLPLLLRHIRRLLSVCFGMQSFVIRVVFRCQESTFRIRHFAEIVINKFRELPSRLDFLKWP